MSKSFRIVNLNESRHPSWGTFKNDRLYANFSWLLMKTQSKLKLALARPLENKFKMAQSMLDQLLNDEMPKCRLCLFDMPKGRKYQKDHYRRTHGMTCDDVEARGKLVKNLQCKLSCM